MSIIKKVLEKAVALQASDIHLTPGQPPIMRVNGELQKSGFEGLTSEHMLKIVRDMVPPHLFERYQASHDTDFSHVEEGVGRFRVSAFYGEGLPSMALRYVKSDIPSFEELNLPPQLKKLAQAERGIIILAGTTSSGKSTTIAALIEEINRTLKRRIITIEDPIEYAFTDNQSVITQREVGLDTESFPIALRHVLRQDPNVIFIGEMRDEISIRTALLASETGHLVVTTLHAGDAGLAIPRMLDVFPSKEQNPIRMALAGNLHAIVCQRLVPAAQGGVMPAVEIMLNTSTVRKLIENNKLDKISAAVETGIDDGMQNFNKSIYDLIKNGKITETEGMRCATNPESLKMNLQGIFLDEGKRILDAG